MLTALLTVLGVMILFGSSIVAIVYGEERYKAEKKETKKTGEIAFWWMILWVLGCIATWFAGYFA